jgi:predicted DNA-binding transcriptional regulator AlpA
VDENFGSSLTQVEDMASALMSWKEIAQHLGKGVRTVQRWEHEGLPVRRPKAGQKGRVLAFPEEIDKWVRTEYMRSDDQGASEVKGLHDAVDKLLAENESLRRNLNALMGMSAVPDGDGRFDGSLLQRCSRALEESLLVRRRCAELMRHHAATRQACAETLDALKNLDALQSIGESISKDARRSLRLCITQGLSI